MEWTTKQSCKDEQQIIDTTEELNGMKQISEALCNKTAEQQLRMLEWAADKFSCCVLCHKPETRTKTL